LEGRPSFGPHTERHTASGGYTGSLLCFSSG
jgi:hypothetical protein